MGKSFRDLKIWLKSYELVLEIYKVTKDFPEKERYGLIDQLRRAANSVAANIAEAHGRYHFADKCRVLYQARGECEEVRSHLSVALGLKYISEFTFKRIDLEYEGLGVGINTYISCLKD
jgi:four helix bundle protein